MTVRNDGQYKTVVSPDGTGWKVTLWFGEYLLDGGLFNDYGSCWRWAFKRRTEHTQGLMSEEGSLGFIVPEQ